MTISSFNNKVICEPYTGGKGLKSEVRSGFATVKQKNNIVGLKVLMDAKVLVGNNQITIPKGATVFFSEETLFLHQQYHNVIQNEAVEKPFVIADFSHIIMIKE